MAKKKTDDVTKELRESAHKIWLAGLGAVATAEEEGSKLFNSLVKKGEKYETKGRKEFDKVLRRVDDAKGKAGSTWDKVEDSIDKKVGEALKRMGVPTRSEINKLTKRVEELTLKVDQLKPKTTKARKTAAA
ncbi:MAG: poly(hydroxyalkanoate) granule-associated protein [Acidobacteria bacterium]|nr:MAG: poly(hydroxyalkanoate) granule-associated protein [Acidobacteriota bacterium]